MLLIACSVYRQYSPLINCRNLGRPCKITQTKDHRAINVLSNEAETSQSSVIISFLLSSLHRFQHIVITTIAALYLVCKKGTNTVGTLYLYIFVHLLSQTLIQWSHFCAGGVGGGITGK